MPPVFHDSFLQKDFDRKGYVVIPGLLNNDNVNRLLDLYKRFEHYYSGPFHTSHFSTDAAYKKEVHDTIANTIYPLIEPYLIGFQALFGNFMIKNPDANVAMDLHADWSYVDESRFRSVAIWVPLVDTNIDNGCLGVIEGSHKITNSIRGPLIRQSSRQHEAEWERRYGKLLPMKAGDAIVYDHALLHYSLPNKSNKPRPALNLSLAPAIAAPWIHYCQPEGNDEIELYMVEDKDFYIRYTNFQRPETGTLIRKMPPTEVRYIDDRMNSFWKQRLFNKIRQLF